MKPVFSIPKLRYFVEAVLPSIPASAGCAQWRDRSADRWRRYLGNKPRMSSNSLRKSPPDPSVFWKKLTSPNCKTVAALGNFRVGNTMR